MSSIIYEKDGYNLNLDCKSSHANHMFKERKKERNDVATRMNYGCCNIKWWARSPIFSFFLSFTHLILQHPHYAYKYEHVVPFFLKHVSWWCLFLDAHPTTHHSDIGVRWRLGLLTLNLTLQPSIGFRSWSFFAHSQKRPPIPIFQVFSILTKIDLFTIGHETSMKKRAGYYLTCIALDF